MRGWEGLGCERVRGDGDAKGRGRKVGIGLRDDGDGLSLKLGTCGGEELVVRPSKRIRLGGAGGRSVGGGLCQVDGCERDLSGAKDYHRRHKVCEVHSKAAKAPVSGEMQRFCQQCSRFHLLLEFDDGKRSCRRRLAGHNQRRRKIQPEETTSQLVLTGTQHNNGVENLELINMLTVLTQLQGVDLEKASHTFPLHGSDELIQILRKMNSSDASSSIQMPQANVPQLCQPSEPLTNDNINSPPLTLDFLSICSTALNASNPVGIAASSQVSSESRDDDSAKKTCTGLTEESSDNNSTVTVPPVVDLNNSAAHSSFESANHPIQDFGMTLQLFSPPRNEYPDRRSSRECMVTPTGSKPLYSSSRNSKEIPIMDACQGLNSLKDSCKDLERRGDSHVIEILQCQKEFPAILSDPYPSRHRYDSQQDRTDRILFKLFNKEPSNFPKSIKQQILEWLSLVPSDMESYMRPGCVILSMYLSMPSMDWDKLCLDLVQRVELLLQDTNSNFWRSSNFLILLNQQMVSHNDGKVHLLKCDKTWSSPELLMVSPLAIVSGKKTNLLLRGRNLRIPGTKIHCTYMDGYTSKEANSDGEGATNDGGCSEHFVIPERPAGAYGRCFIEVENDLRGNSFPVIIADDSICEELRMLETELEGVSKNTNLDHPGQDSERRLREDILQFLNEIGWLFQRSSTQANLFCKYFCCTRFKSLLLFAVERDWSSIVKKILDILVDRSFEMEDLTHQYLEVLREIQPLSRAVKRKNRKLVDMLLNYLIDGRSTASRVYPFLPDLAGPGGITPLHIAASMDDSEEMVDALTNDPQEIGLKCWNTLLDDSGMSPFAYAQLRNHELYNKLVERKSAEGENSQMPVTIEQDSRISSDTLQTAKESDQPCIKPVPVMSCAQCAAALGNRQLNRITYNKGMVYRPYVHSLLAIATVCMCVSMLLRGPPELSSIAPFMWKNIEFGIM